MNPIELAMYAVTDLQRRFYLAFPPCEEERRYRFATPSTMKPTQWSCEPNGTH